MDAEKRNNNDKRINRKDKPMKPRQQLIDEGILNENKITTKHSIAQFYVDQLEKFANLGIGHSTENNVIVTPALIEITQERLEKLRPFLKTRKKGETNGTV